MGAPPPVENRRGVAQEVRPLQDLFNEQAPCGEKRDCSGRFTTEDEAAWTTFLRSLAERDLAGVQLVVSDAHRGLRNALERVFPGASWQRCRVHFLRNVLTRAPRRQGVRDGETEGP